LFAAYNSKLHAKINGPGPATDTLSVEHGYRMRLGYNTNGLAHHDIVQAIELLAEIGYDSVAITVDHQVLNPLGDSLRKEVKRVRECLGRHQMGSVIETGARYLLDPRTKHEPTLVTAAAKARTRRIDFLRESIDLAVELGSDCVSLWSGILRDQIDDEAAFDRLAESLSRVTAHADQQGVILGFEPEPGMFIDTMHRFQELILRVNSPSLQLTLDLGHLHCQGEVPIVDQIRRWGPRIVNVHIEDMCRGIHEHLMFGDGEMEFPPILQALREIEYSGGVHVELSRHSHVGPIVVDQSFHFLQSMMLS
jgi:sugar phosphate isomerase/epimerase